MQNKKSRIVVAKFETSLFTIMFLVPSDKAEGLKSIKLDCQGTTIIGRNETSGITDRYVSREHMFLTIRDNDLCHVKANPLIYINGKPLETDTVLKVQDSITLLGNSLISCQL